MPLILVGLVAGSLRLSSYDDSGDFRPTQQAPITIDQHVGLCLFAHREAVGLSVPAIAAKIGVPAQALTAIEAGMARPTAGCLVMLGALLEVRITDLFLGYVSAHEQMARSQHANRSARNQDNIVVLPLQTH